MRAFIILVSVVLLVAVVYVLATRSASPGSGMAPYQNPGITFLSARDTAQFILSDPDTYAFRLSPLDLHARRAASYQEYARAGARSARCFTPAEMEAISRAVERADDIIRGIQVRGCPDFARNLMKTPWIFASTEGRTYEDGLPHTRLNVIFLSSVSLSSMMADERGFVSTLVHEKIHVQQRLHPVETLALLKERGYIQWKERQGVPRIRANPDLDPWIYIDPKTKLPMAAYYTSDTPSSISDITLSSVSYEHPYEAIAYELTQNI